MISVSELSILTNSITSTTKLLCNAPLLALESSTSRPRTKAIMADKNVTHDDFQYTLDGDISPLDGLNFSKLTANRSSGVDMLCLVEQLYFKLVLA